MIVGADAGAKAKKAAQWQIEVMTEEAFIAALESRWRDIPAPTGAPDSTRRT